MNLCLIVSNIWKLSCADQSYLDLYFKLHCATHRPNLLKKTIIKRRKHVPTAGGVTTRRVTDHAVVAEALVAFVRLNYVVYLERRRATEKYGSPRRRGLGGRVRLKRRGRRRMRMKKILWMSLRRSRKGQAGIPVLRGH